MMKRQEAVILFILCCAMTYAQPRKESLVNYGVKAGFSSTIYDIIDLQVNTLPINNYSAKSEISSFFTAFARFNIKKHYLQTEVSYNISNYSIYFPTDQWDPSANKTMQSVISTKINGIEIPLYYGYHIMKEGPYGMSFYIGPKAKFVHADYSKHTFYNFPYKHIRESIYPINFSIMFGVGINISRVFFDFSLEYGLHNISQGIEATDSNNDINTGGIVFDRRKNVLSFSIGFIL